MWYFRRFFWFILAIGVCSFLLIYFGNRVRIVPRIYYRNSLRGYEKLLEESVEEIEGYFARNIEIVNEFAQISAFARTTSIGFSEEEISAIYTAASRFVLSFPDAQYIRIFNRNFSQLLFTNYEDDIVERSATRISTKPVNQIVSTSEHFVRLRARETDARLRADILFNASEDNIIYHVDVPASDSEDGIVILVYSTYTEIESILENHQLRNVQERVILLARGMLLNGLRVIEYDSEIIEGLAHNTRVIFDNEFEYITLVRAGNFGDFAYLVAVNAVRAPLFVFVGFYGIAILTLILCVLFMMYSSQDPDVILGERMRKFRNGLIYLIRRNGIVNQKQLSTFLRDTKVTLYRKVVHGLKATKKIEENFEKRWRALLGALYIAGFVGDTSELLHTPGVSYRDDTRALPSALQDDSPIAPSSVAGDKDVAITEEIDEEMEQKTDIVEASEAIADVEDVEDVEDIEDIEAEPLDLDLPSHGESAPSPMSAANIEYSALSSSTPDSPHSHFFRREQRGLFALAHQLKYSAIIEKKDGLYYLNNSIAARKTTDRELLQLIESIS